MIIAAKKGDAQSVKELLAKGANVNAKDDKGHTPLGNCKILKYRL
jgi:ankyrin repeat protein